MNEIDRLNDSRGDAVSMTRRLHIIIDIDDSLYLSLSAREAADNLLTAWGEYRFVDGPIDAWWEPPKEPPDAE